MKFRHYLLIFAVAFLARLVVFAVKASPDGWAGFSNGSEFGQVAVNLLEGRGFSSPFEAGSQPTAIFAPLIVFLWAMIFHVTGICTTASLYAIGALQSCAGALTCVLFAVVARRLIEKSGVQGSWIPFAVGVLLALWPESLLVQALPWYFVWQELGLAILFLFIINWFESPALIRTVIIGCVAGVLLLVNPVPVLFIACGLCLMAGSLRDGGARVRHLAVAGVMIAVIVGPWTLRNYMVLGKVIPLRSNFGIELHAGNNESGSIRQTRATLNPALNQVELDAYRKLGEAEYASVAMGKAVSYIRAHPVPTIKRTLQRAYVYWCSDVFNSWPWAEQAGGAQRELLSAREGLRLGRVALNLLPLVCLAALGVTGRLRKAPYLALFACIFICLPLPYYLTHVHEGYAHMVKPYMLVLCMIGIFASGAGKQVTADER